MTTPPWLPDGVILSKVRANGIAHRIATVGIDVSTIIDANGRNNDSGVGAYSGPLVMLLHGWPESWYSWRHQLEYLGRRGCAVCAPDMRGYGGTDSPTAPGSYDVDALVADVLGIAAKLSGERCRFEVNGGDNGGGIILIGHDFGSWLAWRVALLHPDQIRGVVGLSVPYLGESPSMGPLERLRRRYGRSDDPAASREERLAAEYTYMLHHCLPGVAGEYERNAEEALYRLYAYHPGVEVGTPEVTERSMYLTGSKNGGRDDTGNVALDARCAPGFWARLPRPKRLPDWLGAADLAYYVENFRRTGFAGGLSWYRALDLNWSLLRNRCPLPEDLKIRVPCLFACGDEDGVLRAHGGPDAVRRGMFRQCPDLRGVVLLKGGGHWIQQERAEEINAILGDFLDALNRDEGVAQGQGCVRARL